MHTKITRTLWLLFVLLGLSSGCTYRAETPAPTQSIPDCETDSVSYAAFVAPLLNAHCGDCHAGRLPAANIDLTSYRTVRQYANSGLLYGAISHQPDYVPMPKGAEQLPPCDIAKVQAWIEQGVLEN